MAEREGLVIDDGFVPFEPRRRCEVQTSPEGLLSTIDTQPGASTAAVEPNEQPGETSIPPAMADAIRTEGAASSTDVVQTVASAADVPLGLVTMLDPQAQQPHEATPVSLRPCDHSFEIRNEAIHLAAIACGRALRHAALLHPRTIAGFVDDAIAAAGNPRHARIRLHPDAMGEGHDADHERIGDATLGYCDVIVECDDTSLSAEIPTRATLLVRAAADQ